MAKSGQGAPSGHRISVALLLILLGILPASAQKQPKREAWLEVIYRAPRIVERMGCEPGGTVAVFGLSDPAFLRHVVDRLGESGTLLTVDRNRDRFLQFVPMAQEAFGERLHPIFALDGDAHLEEGSVDAIVIVDRDGFFRHESGLYSQAASALRPGGRLVVLRLRDQELSQNAVTATVPKRGEHAYRLEANRNLFRALQEGFQLVDEDLEMMRYRSLRVFEKRAAGEAPVSSGSTGPRDGSAPTQADRSRSPAETGP